MISAAPSSDVDAELSRLLVDGAGLASTDVAAVLGFVRLLASDPTAATDDQRCQAVVAHQEAAAVLAGAAAPWQAAWESSLVWAVDGARSAASWLQTHATVSRTRAAGELRLARGLRDAPLVAAAHRQGRLGQEKTRLLLAARTPRTRLAFDEQQAWLVDTVAGLTVEGAKVFLDRWCLATDSDGPEPRDRTTSHLHLSPLSGAGLRVDGHLAALDAATVADAISARIDAWHHAGLLKGDTRSRSELNAAALAEICGADAATPVRRRPTVLVHLGEAHLDPAPHDPRRDALEPCDLAGHGPVDPRTAQRLICIGDLRRVITGTDGEVLDLGMTARLASAAQRKALIVRGHGHCEYPGCDAPHQWCEAHHVDPYRADPRDPAGGSGPTDISNLALLCNRHHHLVHEGRHRLIRGPDGWSARRPDGFPVVPTYWPEPRADAV